VLAGCSANRRRIPAADLHIAWIQRTGFRGRNATKALMICVYFIVDGMDYKL
jgi:hypothetical protein